MQILLEIIGYTGSALVLLSMAMTSVTKLRRLNMLGSLVSMIYALLIHTYPVVILNLGMIVINAIQLIRAKKADIPQQPEKGGTEYEAHY